jgi:creatinine amidohydrolase
MIVWAELTDSELEEVDRSLPVMVPMGLIEAHGAHISVNFDLQAGEYFARRLCEETGAILCPSIAYGYADTNKDYSGTLGIRAETLAGVVSDLCDTFCQHGFKKIIFLSGHGGNEMPVKLGFQRAWERWPELKPAYWSYFITAGLALHHADEGETSIALAIPGSIVHMDRAHASSVEKPWHEVRSRQAIDPDSGGVNGHPERATAEDGQRMVEQVMAVLGPKVRAAMVDEP